MRYTDTESGAMADTEIYTTVSFCTPVQVPPEVKHRFRRQRRSVEIATRVTRRDGLCAVVVRECRRDVMD